MLSVGQGYALVLLEFDPSNPGQAWTVVNSLEACGQQVPPALQTMAKTAARMGANPTRQVGPSATQGCNVVQEFEIFDSGNWEETVTMKKQKLFQHVQMVLQAVPDSKILAYCSTKNLANELRDTMTNMQIEAEAIHGAAKVSVRRETLEMFNRGEIRLLTTTDVIGGTNCDMPEYTHMVMYDMCDLDTYVHRLGCRSGHSLVLYEPDPSWNEIAKLVQLLDELRQQVPQKFRDWAKQASDKKKKNNKRNNNSSNWGTKGWVDMGASAPSAVSAPSPPTAPSGQWGNGPAAWSSGQWGGKPSGGQTSPQMQAFFQAMQAKLFAQQMAQGGGY